MRPRRISLTFAILASLASLLGLSWILLSLISFKTAEQDLLAEKNEQARLLLATFVSVLPSSPLRVDAESPAGRYAATLERQPDFAGLLLVDAQGRPVWRLSDPAGPDPALLAALRKGGESYAFSADRRFITRYTLLRDRSGINGAARLTLSLDSERQRLSRSRDLFLAYFALDFLLLFVLGYYVLSRIVVVPIKRLLIGTERIAAGDYSHAVTVPAGAEIAALAESFNVMQEALKGKMEEAATYVDSLEKANAELQAAREEAIRSEKMASVGLLAAGMAHEIGTPLAAIIGYAGLLREEIGDDPARADFLRRIEADAGRIDRIVRDLLNYARPAPSESSRIDLAPFLTETLDMLRTQGVFKTIVTEIFVPESIPQLYLDPHQLRQVLINLMINARDAMPHGGRLEISAAEGEFRANGGNTEVLAGTIIRGRRRRDFHGAFTTPFGTSRKGVSCITIQVRDTGEGIAPENLERIFDPFFTTKEPGKGTGLGLAISSRIVDSLGGRITVSSRPGEGTCFTLWLPMKEQRKLRNRG